MGHFLFFMLVGAIAVFFAAAFRLVNRIDKINDGQMDVGDWRNLNFFVLSLAPFAGLACSSFTVWNMFIGVLATTCCIRGLRYIDYMQRTLREIETIKEKISSQD